MSKQVHNWETVKESWRDPGAWLYAKRIFFNAFLYLLGLALCNAVIAAYFGLYP